MAKLSHLLVFGSLFATIMATQADAKITSENAVKEIKFDLETTAVLIEMENVSGTTNPVDFQLDYVTQTVSFNNIKSDVWCGYIQLPQKEKTLHRNDLSELWLGEGGTPQHFEPDRRNMIYGINYPSVTPNYWELKNAINTSEYELAKRGLWFDFEIPIEKLTDPVDLDAAHVDGQALFNHALQEHIDEGGDRLSFLRNDQAFVVDVPMTMAGACVNQDYDYQPYFNYETQNVKFVFRYTGDKSLKYEPAVPTGGGNGIQNKLKIAETNITVNPNTSTGVCPRNINAVARLDFTFSPNNQRELNYRFLENGKPTTVWKSVDVVDQDSIEIPYDIQVNTGTEQNKTKTPFANKISGHGISVVENQDLGLQQKSVVAIQVQLEGSEYLETEQYEAYCVKPKLVQLSPGFGQNGKPDLISRGDIQIGQTSIPWGTSMELDLDDASSVGERGCTFRYAYEVSNVNKAAAEHFESDLVIPNRILISDNIDELAGQSHKRLSGAIVLPQGNYDLRAIIDASDQIDETDESNNSPKVSLRVPSECGGSLR